MRARTGCASKKYSVTLKHLAPTKTLPTGSGETVAKYVAKSPDCKVADLGRCQSNRVVSRRAARSTRQTNLDRRSLGRGWLASDRSYSSKARSSVRFASSHQIDGHGMELGSRTGTSSPTEVSLSAGFQPPCIGLTKKLIVLLRILHYCQPDLNPDTTNDVMGLPTPDCRSTQNHPK